MLSFSRLFFFALLILLLRVTVSEAQLKCNIVHYSTEDGLSHNRVMCILKDHDGFMWFGTWNGLNRFDGHNFVVYKSRPGDTSSLRNDRIQEMLEDRNGYLWLRCYDNRVYRFDKTKGQFLAIEVKIPGSNTSASFSRIFLSRTGQLWLTTINSGIYLVPAPGANRLRCIWYGASAKQPNRIPGNEVNYFFEDLTSNIWLSTSGGVCCLRRSRGNFKAVSAPGVLKSITGIADTQDALWLTSVTGSIFYLNKHTYNCKEKKLTTWAINRILISRHNENIYVTTEGGELFTINRQTVNASRLTSPDGGRLGAMYEDRTGLLWVEPEKNGVLKFDPAKRNFKHFSQVTDAHYDNSVHFFRLTEDNNGLLWVSMAHGGFGYYNRAKDSIDYFYNRPGASDKHFSNIVICIYADPSGVLWFSGDDKGVNKVVPEHENFRHQLVAPHSPIRSDNEIRGIYADRSGRLWVAAKSGTLTVYRSGKPLPVSFSNLPPGGIGIVYKIMEDSHGTIWLGTKGRGLYRAESIGGKPNTYRLTHYQSDRNDPYSLSSDMVYDVLEDHSGRIWVATYENGINLMSSHNGRVLFLNDNNTFKYYPKAAFRKIRDLQEDGSGRLWIATTDGLVITKPDVDDLTRLSFITYTKIRGNPNSLGNNDVQYIYKDRAGHMWIATSGGGLNSAMGNDPLRSLKFKVLTTADGLPSDFILSCIQDRVGRIWLATENGLSRYTPADGTFKNFDSVEGLEGNGFSEASVTTLPDGLLTFGCINGFIYFNPDQLAGEKITAQMALTNFQVNNVDIVPGDGSGILKRDINHTPSVELKYDQNIIGVDYATLDYRSDKKLEYAYRLRNFDDQWHVNKGLRKVVYTNLPPGKYQLELKCVNPGLYRVQPYKQLNILITPPWWKTWWAYLTYAIILIIAAGVGRRIAFTVLRLRQRVAIERRLADLKMNFFTNVSHELRTPLTLILNPIEEIFKKEKLSEVGSTHIRVVRKNAQRMVHFINQLLDLRKAQSGKAQLQLSEVGLVQFIRKIGEYFNDVAVEKQISFQVIAPEELPCVWIDADKIDVVIYNLLSNAFKFCPAQRNVTVRINQHPPDHVTIEIIDDGRGVPEDQLNDIFELYYEGHHPNSHYVKGTGIGLALSRELVELHHGSITARNNPEGGFTVSVTLLQGKSHFNKDQVSFIEAPDSATRAAISSTDELAQLPEPVQSASDDRPLVLLVEDNQELRSFLSFQLSEFYRVANAVNGKIGLEKAQTLLPDLILSDVMMPEMDGITMLDKLKNDVQTSHIPVVLLSARFSVESQIEGLKYGADYYITKPFHNDLLLVAIDNLIRQRKLIFNRMLTGEKIPFDLSPGEITITTQDQQFLKKIIQVVEDGMVDPNFTIDDVVDSVNMGRSTFFRKFKSLTGSPPVDFIREMRIKRAAQLIDAGEHNIADIAYSVGFSSAKYFSKCFKDYYQLTPSEYLKKSQETRATHLQ